MDPSRRVHVITARFIHSTGVTPGECQHLRSVIIGFLSKNFTREITQQPKIYANFGRLLCKNCSHREAPEAQAKHRITLKVGSDEFCGAVDGNLAFDLNSGHSGPYFNYERC